MARPGYRGGPIALLPQTAVFRRHDRPYPGPVGRILLALALVAALACGVSAFVDSTAKTPVRQRDLTGYASAVCTGLAGPANAYRSMLQVQRSDLKSWYATYFDTLWHSADTAMSTLDSYGDQPEIGATDAALKDFFGTARGAAADGARGVAGLRPDDPAFDAKIDTLTGGPIAPERYDAMLGRAKATPPLAAAMARVPGCTATGNDLQLVLQGRMLDLFAGSRPA